MNIFSSRNKVKTVNLAFLVPNETVIRSNLICSYITQEIGYPFTLEDFILLLYDCFLYEYTKVYNPKGTIDILNYSFYDYIYIKNGEGIQKVDRSGIDTKLIEMVMIEEDALKGHVVLEELKELYGKNYTLGNLVLKVWVNFIERFKKDDNNEMLDIIVDMLKN